jgi:hypothetical protein
MATLKEFWSKFKYYIAAFVAGVLVVLAIIFRKKIIKKWYVVNDIPKDRVDANGHPIPIGTSDGKGFTQWEVKPFEVGIGKGGKEVVTVGKDKVNLPTGVTASDVQHVIQVKPDVYVVSIKDTTGVSAKSILSVLGEI